MYRISPFFYESLLRKLNLMGNLSKPIKPESLEPLILLDFWHFNNGFDSRYPLSVDHLISGGFSYLWQDP